MTRVRDPLTRPLHGEFQPMLGYSKISQSNVTIWYDPFLFQVTPLEFVGTVTIVYIVSMRHFVFKLYRALSTRAPPMGNYATLAILHSECNHAVNVRVGLSSEPYYV